MRKRAQRKSKPMIEEPKHIVQKTGIEKKPAGVKKNWWIAVSLIGIFFLVLLLNSYFNITSEISIDPEGAGLDKFYLSGRGAFSFTSSGDYFSTLLGGRPLHG